VSGILFVSGFLLTLSVVELIVKIRNQISDLDLPTFRTFSMSQTVLAAAGRLTVYCAMFFNTYVSLVQTEMKATSRDSSRESADKVAKATTMTHFSVCSDYAHEEKNSRKNSTHS
jgi:hypothetical protein